MRATSEIWSYSVRSIDRMPQYDLLREAQRFDLQVVGEVLPFRVNSYVADHRSIAGKDSNSSTRGRPFGSIAATQYVVQTRYVPLSAQAPSYKICQDRPSNGLAV